MIIGDDCLIDEWIEMRMVEIQSSLMTRNEETLGQ